ncbi:hypothetical protein LTR91_004493 [Friedmanniomyces endolithicus]|uniref:BTB domain-containing protein n=1 Tax=Friedmanniomyces endolithicus TaxID=329885 RepID=A0AAN6QYL2_9PEZI|nr:hypothetical protein LTR75_006736 [Friedmanniomyces endolithicus]KAK0845037.1 hypothetical protein LTR03_007719 [Friedmanniomyces endolithicus]KAK0863290.1 hypothetical protein LTS02_006671 [Friedmanniomyces endolithicus]KAK0880147.1 hypothetical protein LTR87_006053 [Friedmanniomyces endolithicus]KAK0916564.1 hypothetical protein LTR02_000696 [Friedmanniomyces endolithicus]
MAPHYEQTQEKGIARLARGLSSMFVSKNFADLQVVLDDRTWLVHRNIVCCRSDFFARACEGKFMEGKQCIVGLHDDDPDVLDKMFHYIYHNAYDDADTDAAPVLLNVRMVAIAEKYFVDHLAHLAISKLNYFAADAWATQGFADAIEEAYTTTADCDRALRNTLLDIVVQHAHDLFDSTQAKFAHFQSMAARTPSFSAEVTGRLAPPLAAFADLGIYRCPYKCRVLFASSMREAQWFNWFCPQCAQMMPSKSFIWWQKHRMVLRPSVEVADGYGGN